LPPPALRALMRVSERRHCCSRRSDPMKSVKFPFVSRALPFAIVRVSLIVLAAAVLFVPAAAAQPQGAPTKAVVVEEASIYLMPDATRAPLRVARPGMKLEVLETEDNWNHVRFQDLQYGLRTGYIEAKFVRQEMETHPQPMDLAIRTPEDASRPQNAQPASLAPRPQQARGGMWFNAGFGFASAGCDGCDRRVNGVSGGVLVGGTITPRVLLGVGTTGWSTSDTTLGTFDARVRFYPGMSSGFFVTGGVGLGGFRDAYGKDFGVGTVLGLGWDLHVASNVSLTPFWNGVLTKSSVNNINVRQVGLGITIQ
jgi:hypothetical protein